MDWNGLVAYRPTPPSVSRKAIRRAIATALHTSAGMRACARSCPQLDGLAILEQEFDVFRLHA